MFFLPLKLQGCKNEILNYDSCTKPKLIIGPRRFLFLKHWMRNERHLALQRGSLREVSRLPSFLGKSRSEEESVFISPLPVASSRPFRRHNRSARKSLTRGKVCDLFFSMRILLVDNSRSSLHLPTCASAANTLPTRSRSCRSTPARCSVASAGRGGRTAWSS